MHDAQRISTYHISLFMSNLVSPLSLVSEIIIGVPTSSQFSKGLPHKPRALVSINYIIELIWYFLL